MDNITLTLEPGQNLYFTSDLHFGHRNVIKFCERPFEDVKEMNKELIDRWNARVKPNDYIFVLGDTFWFNSRHDTLKIVSQLNGQMYFLLGNHDKASQFELCIEKLDNFHILSDIVQLSVDCGASDFLRSHFEGLDSSTKWLGFCLCHYPLACYSGSGYRYQLFGHIHSRKDMPMMEFGRPILINNTRCMDVGVDRHDWAPVSVTEVLHEIETYPYWGYHCVKSI